MPELDPIVQLTFAVQQVVTDAGARHELSVTQVRLLGVLRDREPTMGVLKDLLALEKSSVSGLVDRAQKRGLVERTTGHADGRAIHVRLTEDGHALANAVADAVYAEVEALLQPLGARDRERLLKLASVVVGSD